jgi:hypothetical protein
MLFSSVIFKTRRVLVCLPRSFERLYLQGAAVPELLRLLSSLPAVMSVVRFLPDHVKETTR